MLKTGELIEGKRQPGGRDVVRDTVQDRSVSGEVNPTGRQEMQGRNKGQYRQVSKMGSSRAGKGE